jgi:hypothetical protein
VPHKIYLEKRRDNPRLPAHMEARIISPGRGSPAPCVVREVSPAGAKLDVDKDWALPKAFWLRISGDSCMHFCTVAWREGDSVGVQFTAGDYRAWWDHAQPLSLRQASIP